MSEIAAQTLDLVGRELNATLTEARVALEASVEQSDSPALLERCADELHQVQGVLRVLEIYGAALLAEEMEKVARWLLASYAERRGHAESLDALMRAMVQLPSYLERVLAGGRDLALILLPLLNDLRAVRGHALLSEGTLLVLNLKSDRQPQPVPAAPGETTVGVDQWARRLRARFQMGLVGWIRGERPEQNLETLSLVAQKLEHTAATQPVFQLWWVVGAVIEALREGGLEAGVSVKRLLGLADREIRRLYEQGESRYTQAPPVELLNNLLYYVGRAQSSGPRVAAVRASFRLAELLPVEESIEEERENLSGPSVKLMQTVAAAIREDLGRVKDVLDIFVRRGAGQARELAPQVELLHKIGDTLGVLGLGEQRASVQTQADRLSQIVAGQLAPEESVLVEIAAAFIGVEDQLDERLVGTILPHARRTDGRGEDEGEEDVEFRQVQAAVLRECCVNLARIKEAVTQNVGGTLDAAGLDSWPELLRGLQAGLLMLGKSRACDILEVVGRHLRTIMQPGGHGLPVPALERLADAIVSVEYYMETLQAGRSDPWYMLENAQTALVGLERSLATPSVPASPADAGEPYVATMRLPRPTGFSDAIADVMAAATMPDVQPLGATTQRVPPPAAVAPAPLVVRPLHPVLDGTADADLVQLFIEEAGEELEKIARSFPLWDHNPLERDALVAIRRSFHTLKGSGRMVGAREIAEFAWAIENLLNRLLDNTLSRSQPILSVLREAVALLPALVEQLSGSEEPRADAAAIAARAHVLAASRDGEVPVAPPAPAKPFVPPPWPIPRAAAAGSPVGETARTVVIERPPGLAALAAAAAEPAEAAALATLDAETDDVLREIYARETGTHVATVRAWLQREASFAGVLHVLPEPVYRACHTLAGSSKMAEARHGVRLAEPLNHWLRKSFDAGVGLTDADLELVEGCMAAMESVATHLDEPTGYFISHAALLERIAEAEADLDRRIASAGAPPVALPATAAGEVEAEEGGEAVSELDLLPIAELVEPVDQTTELVAEPAESADQTAEFVAEPAEPVTATAEPAAEPVLEPVFEQASESLLATAEMLALPSAPATEPVPELPAEAAEAAVAAGEPSIAPGSPTLEVRVLSMDLEAPHPPSAEPATIAEPVTVEPAHADADVETAEPASQTMELLALPPEPPSQTVELLALPPESVSQTMELLALPPEPTSQTMELLALPPEPPSQTVELLALPSEPASQTVELIALSPAMPFGEGAPPAEAPATRAFDMAEEASLAEAAGEFGYEAIDESIDETADEIAGEAVDEATELAATTGIEAAPVVAPVPVSAPAPIGSTAAPADSQEDEGLDELSPDFDPEVAAIFAEEALELLDAAEGALSMWRERPADVETLVALKRPLHTLKGGARMAGIPPMGDLSHELETLVMQIESRLLPPSPEAFAVVQDTLDELAHMRESLTAGRGMPSARRAIQRIHALTRPAVAPAMEPATSEPAAVSGEPVEAPAEAVAAPVDAEVMSGEPAAASTEPVVAPVESEHESSEPVAAAAAAESAQAAESVEPAELAELAESAAEAAPLPEYIEPLSDDELAAHHELADDLGLPVDAGEPIEAPAAEAFDETSVLPHESTVDRALEPGVEAYGEPSADELLAAESRELLAEELPLAGEPELSPAAPPVAEAPEASQAVEASESSPAVLPFVQSPEPAAAPIAPEAPRIAATAFQPPAADDRERLPAPFLVPPGREPVAPADRPEMARVDAELLDTLLNNAGEVSIARARLEQQVGSIDFNLGELSRTVTRLKEQLRKLEIETEAQILHRHEDESSHRTDFDPLELDRYSTIQQFSRALAETANDVASIQGLLENLTRETQNLLTQQGRVVTELQSGLMRTRMVPFQRHVQRFARLVRQAAQEAGKRAELVVEGASGELDRQVLERMLPPFEHMLRNAVAHGIEKAEDRIAAGKPETGRITLELRREGAEVTVRVSDDGAGMNLRAIRDKAVALGLVRPGQELSDEDAMQLVLEPGFSTASSITQTAGRGVGMDVVATEIKKLGGALHMQTRPGQGTTFTIRLPFTLAISHALIVRSGDEFYALPLPTVEGVLRLSKAEVAKHLAADSASFDYGGQKFRFQPLAAYVGLEASPLPEQDVSIPVVLVRAGEWSTGLVADELVGSREIVVKSVGPQIAAIRGISGATILGDGRIVLILDIAALLRGDWRSRMRAVVPREKVDTRTFALVVDDSITVRRVTQRLLERNGMRVLTARDGMDAVALLQEHTPDIILLDIEMPRMDGYEVASHVRNDPRLKEVPIIMITSRAGEKHRARAIELGVDDYLGKPYQEAQLLDAIAPLVERYQALRNARRRAEAGGMVLT